MDKRVIKSGDTGRRHAEDFKLSLVRRSLEPGASVAAIAQEAGVNANLLFNWRRLHLQGREASSGVAPAPVLLPVTIVGSVPAAGAVPTSPPSRTALAGTIEIDFRGARVRLNGAVDEASIGGVLRALAAVA